MKKGILLILVSVLVFCSQAEARFGQQDKWEGDPTRPISQNKYLYAESNPVIYVDPSGYMSLPSQISSLGLQTSIARVRDVGAVQTGKKLVIKAGCMVVEELVEDAFIKASVYVFSNGSGALYVGQTNDIARRLGEHVRVFGDGMIKIERIFNLEGFSKTARRVFEQHVIDALGGRDVLLNKRNAVADMDSKRFTKSFVDKMRLNGAFTGFFKLCP